MKLIGWIFIFIAGSWSMFINKESYDNKLKSLKRISQKYKLESELEQLNKGDELERKVSNLMENEEQWMVAELMNEQFEEFMNDFLAYNQAE